LPRLILTCRHKTPRYQAALAAGSKIMKTSLLDFL